jgi:RNA polymerase sigma-70 factor (ECF subfamily)
MLSDEALIERSLTQGNHHFGELVKRYSDYLFGFGIRLTAGDSELAKDLSQQTFVRAFRYLHSFDTRHQSSHAKGENRFRNWLTGIAVNCFNDLIKKENRYQELDDYFEPRYEAQYDESREFFDLISPLTKEERLIFILKYVYEFKIDEIARMTALNSGTVKSKISRALERLRERHDERV